MAIIPDKALDILAEPESVKMVATTNKDGIPNVVIISTISVLDLETIAFADLCLGTTKKNLKQTGKLTVTVLGKDDKAFQIRCSFINFDNKSDLYDTWHIAVWNRMRLQLKAVALARVDDVIEIFLDRVT